MQAHLTDRKLSILFDRYKDADFAANAQKEVEDIRKKAVYRGAIATGAAFVINEVTRLSARSPIFKLNPQNTLFWLIAPTLLSKYYYDNHIHERIDDLWKVHTNRVEKGLGGTYKATGVYNDWKRQDREMAVNNGTMVRLDRIITGAEEQVYIDNPFTRFHEGIEKYPDFHDDIDDIRFMEYDNWERLKPFQPQEGTTVGETNLIPPEDNDQKLYFYDVQGESVYTNPPDPNAPVIDHGLDEEHVWAFQLTGYNQQVIRNTYLSKSYIDQAKQSHVPYWGKKLMMPAFFKEEKLDKFYRHWSHRLGLENIKIKQAITYRPGDKEQYRKNKEEIEAYLLSVQEAEMAETLKDVYVTDHQPKPEKYWTSNKKEDEQYFKYFQALQEYKNTPTEFSQSLKQSKFEVGSALQKVLDPLAGAEEDEAGNLHMQVTDTDLSGDLSDEERLRKEYALMNQFTDGKFTDAQQREYQYNLLLELEKLAPIKEEELNESIAEQVSIFKQGEQYDYVKDMRDAFAPQLKKSTNQKIFQTLPEWVFWDIKKPIGHEQAKIMNEYNPFRKYHTESFFDARDYEEYMERRLKKNNLADGVSLYRRY